MSTIKTDTGDLSFARAIKDARKKAGLSQENFGKIFEISKSYVLKLESGQRIASVRLKKDIERWINRDISSEPNFSPGPSRESARKIPIISWVQAGGWQEVCDPYQPGYAEDWVFTTETNHPNAFALVVHGDSMEPEFLEGDIITIDPGRNAASGSYVIAKNGEEATFKQLVLDGSSVYLKPLNSRYPIKDVTGVEIKIVGVVVEKRKRY